MKRNNVSNNVIRRLPRYLRKLDDLAGKGEERISSDKLGRQMGLTPSQIRQDFSCFGEFGQQGYGYNVDSLRKEISQILGTFRGYSTILVGAGNLGTALVQNFDFIIEGFSFLGAFDINRHPGGGRYPGDMELHQYRAGCGRGRPPGGEHPLLGQPSGPHLPPGPAR